MPVLELAPSLTVGFLAALPERPGENVIIDDSLRFWREAAKLLLELLCRGRFLPSLEHASGDGHFRAAWKLLPDETYDQERIALLQRAVPLVCHALGLAPTFTAHESGLLLESFFDHCGDALVRSFLARSPVLGTGTTPESRIPSAGEAWLAALTSRDPSLTQSGYEMAKLEQQLQRWNLANSKATQHRVRACLQLQPPNEASDSPARPAEWSLRFLLQSEDSPDHILPAADLWAGERGFLAESELTSAELEEVLLRGLGTAAQHFPPLRRALESPFPCEAVLSTIDAYEFLREAAPALSKAGIGTMLPDWWNDQASGIGLRLKVETADRPSLSSDRQSPLGMNQLVEFSWEISVGENRLSSEAFRELVQSNIPLVYVAGRWVELKPKETKKALSFLDESSRARRIPLIEALRLGFGIGTEQLGLPVVAFDASGWVRSLLDATSSNFQPIEQPAGFTGDLRPYQLRGISWLSFLNRLGFGACLADDMGLGKTIQLLALLLSEWEAAKEREAPPPAGPTLLIVPMSILDNWKREAERFTPALKTYVHHGSTRAGFSTFCQEVAGADIVITTYSVVYRDLQIFSQIRWGRI
ncbi:MAG: DEAD/DEAH box helicase, partial [Bdellovibrionales bacterium]|nr:DEAD/DEAH box helicase [Bdellovibrionales bacterium]